MFALSADGGHGWFFGGWLIEGVADEGGQEPDGDGSSGEEVEIPVEHSRSGKEDK